MKKITLLFSALFLFTAAQLSAQLSCNNTLSASISGVVNSSTCTTPCNGQATGSASGATQYVWVPSNQQSTTATGLCAGTYTFYAFDATFANCGSATVTITCPQAVNEATALSSVELFPNPSSDMLNINFSYPNGGSVKEVLVFNAIGEMMLTENYASKKYSGKLFIGNLSKGVYFLELKDEKNSYRTRFIKE